MTRRNKNRVASSVLTDGQPSFVEEEPRRGKQFDGGRKVTDQSQVGATSPDSDTDKHS